MDRIEYRRGNELDLDTVIELYRASTLGERRPVDDRAAMDAMLAHGNLTVTAWQGTALVGLARSLTDFAYVAYLSDLAVHLDFQRRGIGTELIAHTRLHLGPRCRLVLVAAPKAVAYYPRIGFSKVENAWSLAADAPFPAARPQS